MHGFVVLRRESHAVVFLTDDEGWSYDLPEAKRFDSRLVAERCRRRVGGHDVMGRATAEWLRPPTVRPLAMYALATR